jgi:hypothetical protein
MRRLSCSLGLTLLLAGCYDSKVTFQVVAEGGQARTAELFLCNSITEMKKVEGGFTEFREFGCEGAGLILVTYEDGTVIPCRISYVTAGFRGTVPFRADKGRKSCSQAGDFEIFDPYNIADW